MTSLAGADSAQELLGLSFYDLIHPDYHATKRVRIERLQRTGSISAGSQIRLLRRDGSTLPVMTVATKITSRGRSSAIFAVTDLSDAERAHSLLTAVMRSVTDAIVTIDDRGVVQSINPAAEMLFGMSTDELIGHQIDLILPTPISSRSGEFSSFIAQHASKNHETRWEIELRRKDNMVIPVELSVTEFQLDGRRHYTGVARDISERRRLEEQLRQSQKMEAIGQLAGGIAHDFNNLIMVINGYGQLLSSELPADHPWFTSLQEILKSARSGSDLVRQLLAFSRKQRLQPRPIDLHQLILKSENMLRRLIGDGVLLQIGLRANRSFVMADPGQIEQVLLNLAVNARDAMNGQGQLRIETRNMSLLEEGGPPVEEGRPAIELSVSDSGCGMDAATIERIFEPFFTTKPMGVGTGLGLSTVYGIVQQSGGSISVHSQPGEGAQFLVRLPITDQFNAAEKKAPAHPVTSDTASRHETVLLVEDFAQLRALSAKLLRQRGYNVLEACDGADAERRYSARISEIDLLVTDIVMPHVSGLELIRRVRKLKPSLRVLMMSGYADSDPSSAADGLEPYTYVRKPCAPDEFLDAVDQALRSNATS